MKIYILADMEGISGIRKMADVKRDSPADYAEGCKLMMMEINQCIAGAFEGGATEVTVCDTHGGGEQVLIAQMDARAVYELPACGRIMPSLDESYSGVILLGHHARAGTVNGFLDHTMNSSEWFEYRINDQVVGEIGIEAAWAGHYGVPVIMVSGDEATAQEAFETLGEVECAVVKWGQGRNRAKCLPLPVAHDIIRNTAAQAVRLIGKYKPFTPQLPATIELTLYRSDMCDNFAVRPGVERVNARTVRKKVDKLIDICRW